MGRYVIYQLPEPIQVMTPLGHGYAILVEAGAHDYWWTVALDNCALVTFTQDRIRVTRSYSHGRSLDDEEMKGIIDEAAPRRQRYSLHRGASPQRTAAQETGTD